MVSNAMQLTDPPAAVNEKMWVRRVDSYTIDHWVYQVMYTDELGRRYMRRVTSEIELPERREDSLYVWLADWITEDIDRAGWGKYK